MLNSLSLNKLLEPIVENKDKIDIITNYSKENTLIEKTVKKGTETFLKSISEWIKNGAITVLNYAGGLCFIVGSIAIIGLMIDSNNELGCKKYIVGSILVYIGIKCIQIILV